MAHKNRTRNLGAIAEEIVFEPVIWILRHGDAEAGEGKPDAELLAYQYLQMLPQIAQGDANKVWIVPSDLQQAVGRLAGGIAATVTPPAGANDGGTA